jgi:hypothetical protein
MFHVPDVDPTSPRNRFSFTVPRRRWWQRSTISIPLVHVVPLTVMREAKAVDAPEQLAKILELMGETVSLEAVSRLSQPEIRALELGWLEASAPGLGELAASLSLSKSTRGPSEGILSETVSDSTG